MREFRYFVGALLFFFLIQPRSADAQFLAQYPMEVLNGVSRHLTSDFQAQSIMNKRMDTSKVDCANSLRVPKNPDDFLSNLKCLSQSCALFQDSSYKESAFSRFFGSSILSVEMVKKDEIILYNLSGFGPMFSWSEKYPGFRANIYQHRGNQGGSGAGGIDRVSAVFPIVDDSRYDVDIVKSVFGSNFKISIPEDGIAYRVYSISVSTACASGLVSFHVRKDNTIIRINVALEGR